MLHVNEKKFVVCMREREKVKVLHLFKARVIDSVTKRSIFVLTNTFRENFRANTEIFLSSSK